MPAACCAAEPSATGSANAPCLSNPRGFTQSTTTLPASASRRDSSRAAWPSHGTATMTMSAVRAQSSFARPATPSPTSAAMDAARAGVAGADGDRLARHREPAGESAALLPRSAEDADPEIGDVGKLAGVGGSRGLGHEPRSCHTSPVSAPEDEPRRHWLSRMRLDVTPLRTSRDFRIIFASGLVTYLGSMITYVALPFQVAQLTGSYVAVGLIGLAELIPLIVFGLYGGALADSVDRKVMVIATELASGALVAVLLVNSLLPTAQLWVLYAVAMMLAAVDGLQRPSLDAMIPRVVAHDQLAAASALVSLRWQLGSHRRAGDRRPAAQRRRSRRPRTAWTCSRSRSRSCCSCVCAASAQRPTPTAPRSGTSPKVCATPGAARTCSARMRSTSSPWSSPSRTPSSPSSPRTSAAPGRSASCTPPALSGRCSSPLTSGWTSSVHRHGRAIVFAAAVWGLGIALVGLSQNLWLGAALPRRRRRRGHGQRDLPQRHVEPDDSR